MKIALRPISLDRCRRGRTLARPLLATGMLAVATLAGSALSAGPTDQSTLPRSSVQHPDMDGGCAVCHGPAPASSAAPVVAVAEHGYRSMTLLSSPWEAPRSAATSGW